MKSSGAFSELEVAGHEPAILYVPASERPLPLIVASHGAGGVAEFECEYWRQLSEDRAIIVCPRGVRTRNDQPSGYFYRTHLTLETEVLAVVAAARRTLGERVAPDGGLYAGFSQGAIMGAGMIAPHGAYFPHLVLIEGGYEYWSPQKAQQFKASGGRRVVFVCGTPWCRDHAQQPAQWLVQAGVEARVEFALAGHTPSGPVMRVTRAALPWLLAGDARWRSE